MYKCNNPPRRKFPKSFDQNGVPVCLKWTVDEVGDWIEFGLNLSKYRDCFTSNFINGKRLINVDASALPRMGITDFKHIQFITKNIREMLGINFPDSQRDISLLPKEPLELFIERKSFTGNESSALTFDEHLHYLEQFEKHGV